MDKVQLDKLLMKIINNPKNKIEPYIGSFFFFLFFNAKFTYPIMKRIDLYFKGDIIMTNNQIDELNELLKDHAETLTAFGDELLNYGMKRGSIAGCLGTYLGIGISLSAFYIAKKIKSRKSKKEESNEEES